MYKEFEKKVKLVQEKAVTVGAEQYDNYLTKYKRFEDEFQEELKKAIVLRNDKQEDLKRFQFNVKDMIHRIHESTEIKDQLKEKMDELMKLLLKSAPSSVIIALASDLTLRKSDMGKLIEEECKVRKECAEKALLSKCTDQQCVLNTVKKAENEEELVQYNLYVNVFPKNKLTLENNIEIPLKTLFGDDVYNVLVIENTNFGLNRGTHNIRFNTKKSIANIIDQKFKSDNRQEIFTNFKNYFLKENLFTKFEIVEGYIVNNDSLLKRTTNSIKSTAIKAKEAAKISLIIFNQTAKSEENMEDTYRLLTLINSYFSFVKAQRDEIYKYYEMQYDEYYKELLIKEKEERVEEGVQDEPFKKLVFPLITHSTDYINVLVPPDLMTAATIAINSVPSESIKKAMIEALIDVRGENAEEENKEETRQKLTEELNNKPMQTMAGIPDDKLRIAVSNMQQQATETLSERKNGGKSHQKSQKRKKVRRKKSIKKSI